MLGEVYEYLLGQFALRRRSSCRPQALKGDPFRYRSQLPTELTPDRDTVSGTTRKGEINGK